MLLANEYKAEVKDFIREADDNLLAAHGYTKQELLNDKGKLNAMWISYQKSVEEYAIPMEEAFQLAMADVLNITC